MTPRKTTSKTAKKKLAGKKVAGKAGDGPARKTARKAARNTGKGTPAKKKPYRRKVDLPELSVVISLQGMYLEVPDIEVSEASTIVLSLDPITLPGAIFRSLDLSKAGFHFNEDPALGNFRDLGLRNSDKQVQIVDNHRRLNYEWSFKVAVRASNGDTHTTAPPSNSLIRTQKDPIIINR